MGRKAGDREPEFLPSPTSFVATMHDGAADLKTQLLGLIQTFGGVYGRTP